MVLGKKGHLHPFLLMLLLLLITALSNIGIKPTASDILYPPLALRLGHYSLTQFQTDFSNRYHTSKTLHGMSGYTLASNLLDKTPMLTGLTLYFENTAQQLTVVKAHYTTPIQTLLLPFTKNYQLLSHHKTSSGIQHYVFSSTQLRVTITAHSNDQKAKIVTYSANAATKP